MKVLFVARKLVLIFAVIYILTLEEEGHTLRHQVLKKFYRRHGKFKAYLIHFTFQSFEINYFVFRQVDGKKADLQLDNDTSSNKEKGNVVNSELGGETHDIHTWCDARLGDLIVIVKSNGFPVQNMQLLNSTNTSLHLHSLCRTLPLKK